MKLRLLLTALCHCRLLSLPLLAQPAARSEPATLEFVENKGQWDARVRYAAALPSGRLFAETDGLTFSLLDAPALARHGQLPAAEREPAASNGAKETPLRGHAVTLRFVGAAPASLQAREATAERRNYLLGNDPTKWAQDARGFRELRYAGLWPGVSARVYESTDQHLEYDFELAAGTDAAAIALRHEGATAVELDAAGNLQVKTSVGAFTERVPRAWQPDAAGQRQPVPCRYRLAADGTVHFALGRYDTTRPLTIDPVVVFSTYSGSFADNWGFTATYDALGNLYSGGIAFDIGYPTTSGAYQTTFGGIADIALIKYNTGATGPGARVWATYLGGTSSDFPTSLVVNSLGELLVLGVTSSGDYPTTGGAVQRFFRGGPAADPYGTGGATLPNGSDLVITRLNASGSGLVGSTFLGGTANDGLLPFNRFPNGYQLVSNYGDPFRGDILVDAADNVYVASHTASNNFPAGPGFRGTYQGGATDGVVLKLNPALTAVTWGGYLGGAGADAAYSLQVAPSSGDVYVAGGTLSPNFPGTAGSYHAALGGVIDGFVARIAANGLSLTRATYVGTDSYDQAYFLQLGTDGGVYVMGQTLGAFPHTPGLFSAGNGTLFIQKLAADLGSSLFSTSFGSTDPQYANRIALNPTAFLVDRCDRVYACGWGGDSNRSSNDSYLGLNAYTFGLPLTANAVQPTTDGSDFYLAQFSAGLTQLEYGTYYGRTCGTGDHVDGGTARFDPRGVVYQSVCSCRTSTGFPIPGGVNTFSTTNNSSNCNNAAFVLNFQPTIASAGTDQTVCTTDGPVPLVGIPAGGVWTGPGVSGSLATGFFFTPSPALLGVQTLTYSVASTGLCSSVGTRRMTVGVPPAVTFGPVGSGVFCRAATAPPLAVVPLVGSPAGGTFSGPGVANGAFNPGAVAPGTYTLTYTYTSGCTVAVTQAVQVVTVAAGAARQVCAPGAPVVLAGSPAGGTWSGPGVSGSVASGFVFTPTVALAGANTLTYTVTTTNPTTAGQCTAASTVVFTVAATPVVSVTPLPPQCVANLAVVPLGSLGTPANGDWSGRGVNYGNIGYYFVPSTGVGTYQLTYTVRNGSCSASSSFSLTVFSQPVVSAPADTVLCPGSTQPFRLRASLPGGTWTGPGVTGSVAAGFTFTPTAALAGTTSLVYSVVNGGCTGTATRRVTVVPAPAVTATWAPVACPETRLAPLTLRFALATAGGSAPTSRVWDFGDGTQSTELAPTHTYAAAGSYQPRLRVRYNFDRCETQVDAPPVEVVTHPIPNIITPNGDALNETFKLGPDCPPRLQIFSRWGRKVFEAAAYRDDWRAEGQPDGVYYYLITYPDGHRLKGLVEVVR